MNKRHTIRTLYSRYKRKVEDPLTYNEYKALKEVFKRISRAIIVDKMRYKMPQRLGYIQIVKYKSTPKNLDFTANAKKKGKVYTNYHTGGKSFRFKWFKRNVYCSFTNRNKYKFTPVPDKKYRYIGKRGLAQYIFECSRDPYKKDYDTVY